MALIYFDSSGLVKLLVPEEGSDLAAELWDGGDAALAGRLAYPGVCAALAAACAITISVRMTSTGPSGVGAILGLGTSRRTDPSR